MRFIPNAFLAIFLTYLSQRSGYDVNCVPSSSSSTTSYHYACTNRLDKINKLISQLGNDDKLVCEHGCCGDCTSQYCCPSSVEAAHVDLFDEDLCEQGNELDKDNGAVDRTASEPIPKWAISLICVFAFLIAICLCKILVEIKMYKRSQRQNQITIYPSPSAHELHREIYTSDLNEANSGALPSYKSVNKSSLAQSNNLFQQDVPPPYHSIVQPKSKSQEIQV